MGPEYEFADRYRNTTAGHAVDYPKVEAVPASDAKAIRQQIIDLAGNMREVRYQLEETADRFWGCVPTEAAKPRDAEDCGDTLRGVHQALDEARNELVDLRRVAARFGRLA